MFMEEGEEFPLRSPAFFFPLGLFANVSPLKIWALGEFIELSTVTFHGNHFDPH